MTHLMKYLALWRRHRYRCACFYGAHEISLKSVFLYIGDIPYSLTTAWFVVLISRALISAIKPHYSEVVWGIFSLLVIMKGLCIGRDSPRVVFLFSYGFPTWYIHPCWICVLTCNGQSRITVDGISFNPKQDFAVLNSVQEDRLRSALSSIRYISEDGNKKVVVSLQAAVDVLLRYAGSPSRTIYPMHMIREMGILEQFLW